MRPQIGSEKMSSLLDGTTLRTLSCTSIAAPSQWEGPVADGRSIYIRFRHGRGVVKIDGFAKGTQQSPIEIVFDGYGRVTNIDPLGAVPRGSEQFNDSFLSSDVLLDLLDTFGMDVAAARIEPAYE